MSEFEPRPDDQHLDIERLRLTGARFAAHIDAGTATAIEAGRDVDTGTARGIAHVLGRAFGRASHLARFGRENEGRYEDLREEYLQLYRDQRLSADMRSWIDWLGAYLLAKDRTGTLRKSAKEQRAPELPLLLVRTRLTIDDQVVTAHVPADKNYAEIAELGDHLAELQIIEDEALRAFVGLSDVDAMTGNVMEAFHEAFCGTYADEEDALRALSPLADWEGELASWRLDRGIEDEALEFNLAPLIERLRTVYDLVATPGGVHAFIK